MKMRKILLWGLPFLFIGVVIFSIILQNQPEEIADQYDRVSPIIDYFTVGGMPWFLVSIIIILWIATFFNVLLGVLVAVVLGFILSLAFGPPIIHSDKTMGGDFINPGVIGTYLGILGGMIGRKYSIILAIVGCIIGSVFTYFLLVLLTWG